MRNKDDIALDIAEIKSGQIRASQCIFCDKSPDRKIGSLPICNKCYRIHHLLNEYQAAI